jgi:hypothetical protein
MMIFEKTKETRNRFENQMDSLTTTDGINNERRTEEKNDGQVSLVHFAENEKNLFDISIQEELPSVISFTKSFNDIQLCVEWIVGRRLKDEKVILVLDDLPTNIEEVIERLHSEPQLHSIFFFDQNIEQWTEKYPKVSTNFVHMKR